MAEDREVRFCYRCGKRVGKNLLNCWYCSSPTMRVIRPPRNCPYCQSRIPTKAIKCAHCGEFVDGRAQPAAPQHFTLNIDKAVIGPGGLQPMSGPQGQPQPYNPQQFYAPPPEDPSRTLDGQGRQQLPPGGSELLLPDQGTGGMPLAPKPRQMLPGTGGDASGSSLAPYQGQQPLGQPAPGGADFLALSRRPDSSAGKMVPHVSGATVRGSSMRADAEDDRYAVCPVCQTEILNSDSFCFYCGQVHTASTEKPARPAGGGVIHGESNTYIYALSLVLFALTTPQLQALHDSDYRWGAIGAGFLLLIWAFFRNTKLTSRILTVVMILIGIVLISL